MSRSKWHCTFLTVHYQADKRFYNVILGQLRTPQTSSNMTKMVSACSSSGEFCAVPI